MSVLPILKWPDPKLSQVCSPLEAITPDVECLAADMLDTMYAAPGRGLAAPQVGVLQRMFVMDTEWKDADPDPIVFINPVLQEVGRDLKTGAEGCLSIPGVTARVTRPAIVEMSWTNLAGEECSARFEGFGAACVQHELDHLNGVVTFDRVSQDDRAALIAEYEAQ